MTGLARAKPGTAIIQRLSATASSNRPMLQRGSRGHYVKVVQRWLGVAVDGIYGPITEAAVERFQRNHGLLVDGIVGPNTWEALDRVYGGNTSRGGDREPVSGAAAAVDYAYAQLDDRYAYGGDGPEAFDCSGLTMMAWQQAGVQLPHSSSQQAQYGTAVSWSQLQPGDLMFFYNPISHVGIYVGDGKMIAASNPQDDVELVNVNVDYWRNHFTAARRY